MSNLNAVFQSFRCPNFDSFFSRTFNSERNLATCSERVKNIYPRNVYQIQETIFDKLDPFGIKCTSQQKLLKNLAIIDFEPICLQEESFKYTKPATWIGKHVPILVSISSNLVEEPFFLYNSDPHHLVSSFIGTLEGLASQSEAQLKLFSLISRQQLRLSWAASCRNLPNAIIEDSPRGLTSQDDCDNEICASTPFLQIQKKSINWSSRISGTLRQCFTCVLFQQCKIRSQLNPILFATHSC